jgi:vacuolar-type H+-ATPase subunit I/STV1
MWARMVAEMVERPGLRFLTGVVLIPLGAAIYLTNPWVPGDWLAVLVTVLGGLCVLEGCAMIAIGDLWMGLAGRIIASASRMWALFSAAIGIALVAVALLRL